MRMHKDRYIGTLVKMYLVLVCFVLILAEKLQQDEKFILEVGTLEREHVNSFPVKVYSNLGSLERVNCPGGKQLQKPVCMDFGNIQNYSIIKNVHFILLLTSTKCLTVHLDGGGTYLGHKQFLNFYSLDI